MAATSTQRCTGTSEMRGLLIVLALGTMGWVVTLVRAHVLILRAHDDRLLTLERERIATAQAHRTMRTATVIPDAHWNETPRWVSLED